MTKFYVAQLDTFLIEAETLEEAQFIWRKNQLEGGGFDEKLEFIDGSATFTEEDESNG